MSKAFVGFFDILGFKEMVERNSHQELIRIYEKALYQNLDSTEKMVNPIHSFFTPKDELDSLDIRYYVISDSVIIIQENTTYRGFLNVLTRCHILLSTCVSEGIPLRGAVSFGPISTIENKRGLSVVGKGLTKAYQLENSQLWSGGIVDPICFDQFPGLTRQKVIDILIGDKVNPLCIKYNIPLKNGKFRVGYGFPWPKYLLIKNEDDVREAFQKHRKVIDSDHVELMLENTLKYFRHVKSLLNL